MASGLQFNDKSTHFEATYEHPWGGVASDAYQTDIKPNELVQCDNVLIKNGTLNAACLDSVTQNVIHINNITSVIDLTFGIFSKIYWLDDAGKIYGINGNTIQLLATNVNCSGASCVQIINGLAYIFCAGSGKMCIFDPTGPTLTLAESFVAGNYCCVIDSYLLTADTNQPTDIPAIKPNRVNWSAPGAYSTWDPSVDRTSGFNTLTDVSDYISGMFAMGNVGYILRGQGLTQMTPTGIGIKPFDFTTLWASQKGLGCTLPQTFAQYGNVAIWGNDTDFYVFSSGTMPSKITGAARKAIYRDILIGVTLSTTVYGCISSNVATNNFANNSIPDPDLRYYLTIIRNDAVNKIISIIIWVYNLNLQTWSRITFTTGYPVGATNFQIATLTTQYISDLLNTNINVAGNRQVPILTLSFLTAGNAINQVYSIYESDISYVTQAPIVIPAPTIIFKSEMMKIGRKPNVRGVAILAVGSTTPRTINVSVQNETVSTTFDPIIVQGTTPKVYISNGMFTDERPQLKLSSNAFDGTIVKAIMYGTYAEGELP